MAGYLGIINTLPYARISYTDRNPSFLPPHTMDNSILKLPSETDLLEPDFTTEPPDIVIENLFNRAGNLADKIKAKIESKYPQAEEKFIKLANRPWEFLINPNPEPKPQFQINVAGLTPKMKKELMKLYDYAKKKLGVTILVNDAARTEKQQQLVKGGAKCSAHMQRIAVDIHIDGKSIEEAQPYLKKLARFWEGRGHRWGGRFGDPWHFDLVPKGHVPICLNNTKRNMAG